MVEQGRILAPSLSLSALGEGWDGVGLAKTRTSLDPCNRTPTLTLPQNTEGGNEAATE